MYLPASINIPAIALAALLGLGSSVLSAPSKAAGDYAHRPEVSAFIDEMVTTEGFDAATLGSVFAAAKFQQPIVDAISRPAEKVLTWRTYQDIFLTNTRVSKGREFMQRQHEALSRATAAHGVPAEVITAIIGVETLYGTRKGSWRVIDALSTLAFDYSPRAKFFRSELKHFLLLAREENVDPLLPVGSYAGAMGYGQFIASSYRHYAIDFDGDGKRDIWENPVDAIGSVANYLAEHGWQASGAVTLQTSVPAAELEDAYSGKLKPSISLAELAERGMDISTATAYSPTAAGNLAGTKVAPIRLEGKQGPEYWIGFKNFYVITRYNHSNLYAMAVHQLSQRLRDDSIASGPAR
jgi:membrane-bound lytic murein transglycosylase B